MKKIILSLSVLTLLGFSATSPIFAKAKKKGGVAQSSKIGVREKKILAMSSDYPEFYAVKRPQFFIRGIVTNIAPSEDQKDWELSVLPIEVLKNPNHYIKMPEFKEGIKVKIKPQLVDPKQLSVGSVVEYNYYTIQVPDPKATGAARLISEEIHEEFKPYNVAPIAYLTKGPFEPEQELNALKGVNLFQGPIEQSEELKTKLKLLSKNKNSLLSSEAKKAMIKIFASNTQPAASASPASVPAEKNNVKK